MNPYRSHSAFDERRVRRLIRKQSRIDKRILARAEQRFQREEATRHYVDVAIVLASTVLGIIELFCIFSM